MEVWCLGVWLWFVMGVWFDGGVGLMGVWFDGGVVFGWCGCGL